MNKNVKRNLIISILILPVLYFAKMEAINFLVAVWAGVWVTFKLWPRGMALKHKAGEIYTASIRFPFSLLVWIVGAAAEIAGLWIFPALLFFLPGIASSYLVYSYSTCSSFPQNSASTLTALQIVRQS